MPAINIDLSQPLADALIQMANTKAAIEQAEKALSVARTNHDLAKAAVKAAVDQS